MTLIHIHLLTTTAQIDIIIYFYLGALGSMKSEVNISLETTTAQILERYICIIIFLSRGS